MTFVFNYRTPDGLDDREILVPELLGKCDEHPGVARSERAVGEHLQRFRLRRDAGLIVFLQKVTERMP